MTRTRWALVLVAVLLLLVGAGVAVAVLRDDGRAADAASPSAVATTGPRALTTEEAERLAVARFLAYQDGSREFRTQVSTGGTALSLHGRVDYRAGLGIAAVATGAESAVVAWNTSTFIGWDATGDGESVPTQAPVEPGGSRPLDPRSASVDTVLLLLLGLGADRPDNAQLLQQSDAAWMRSDQIGGISVDVFSGPTDAGSAGQAGTTRFWIDRSGALLRFEADLPAGTVAIDLIQEKYVAVPGSPQFG